MDYRAAGVDVEAGYKSVELIKGFVAATRRSEVIGGLGGFGAAFSISKAKNMEAPVLISGTDGVGSKLKIAFLTGRHDTVGIDCVAMCVNDVVCSGAEPLFFLDYIACGKNEPEKTALIVKGVAEGCLMAGCSLVGGETAEMPGFYLPDEYDLAGFTVGIVEKSRIIDGSRMKAGDVIIGLASSGLHSNGFSLVRKALRPSEGNIGEFVSALGCTLGEEMMKPTKIYVKAMLELIERIDVKGIANITGGGFIENIPRMMGVGLKPVIRGGSWPEPAIFSLVKRSGDIRTEAMFNTFNMGIGMTLAVSPEDADKAVAILDSCGENSYIIGEVISGDGIEICYA